MSRTPKAPGSFERRGDSIRVRLCVGGNRHYFTLPTSDLKAAKKWAREKSAELEKQVERVRQGLPGSMPFSALLAKFEAEILPTLAPGTRTAYLVSFDRFREFFVTKLGDKPVDQIRVGHIADFLAWRRVHRGSKAAAKPLHLRTLQKDRSVLHRLFALAEQLELTPSNPVKNTTAPKPDARSYVILNDAQYECLLSECAADDMLSLYATVLGESGVRCESEALWLRWEDIDLASGHLWIVTGRDEHRTKSGKTRKVPITKRLRAALTEHMLRYRGASYGKGTSPWVFHHTTTRRHSNAGDRLASMRDSFTAASDRAKLPADFRPHDLRHRRVTTWLAAGHSPALVQLAMGHSDLKTTMGYAHLAGDDLQSLVADAPMSPRNLGRL